MIFQKKCFRLGNPGKTKGSQGNGFKPVDQAVLLTDGLFKYQQTESNRQDAYDHNDATDQVNHIPALLFG